MAETKLARTVGGKTEEVLIIVWNGVRIMRGTPHRDGPQGSYEKIDLAGAAAEEEVARRVAALLAEGFTVIAGDEEDDGDEAGEAEAVPAKPRAKLAPSKACPVGAKPAWMKRLAPPLDRQMASLHKTLVKVGLAHRAPEIEALARPGIGLSLKRAKPADLKAIVSRIGGDPDLPPGMKWPAVKGVDLAFVAQIVASEMKPHDVERVLPSAGVLSFFAQLDHRKGDYGEVGVIAQLPASPRLVRTPPPAGVVRIEKPGLLTPKVRLTLPPHEEPAIEGLRLNGDEARIYHDQVFLPSIPEGRVHVLAGWASAATRHGIQGKRFAAQIDSDHHIDFEMGDYETLRFYVNGAPFEGAALRSAVATMSEA